MADVKKNIDRIKEMSAKQLTVAINGFKELTIYMFIDMEKWLEAPEDADIYDFVIGEKATYHDKTGDEPCWIVEKKKMMNSDYLRIITKRPDRLFNPAIYTVPAHLVS